MDGSSGDARDASSRANSAPASVGLFDSGWGGLSVVLAIRAALPTLRLRYLADHAWCPYGGREPGTIRGRAVALASALVRQGCGAVVVACNTASSLALDDVRAAVAGVPVVGVVPAVKPAAARSRSGRIAVLATPATAAGGYLARLIADHAPGIRVDVVPAPGLVAFVERGETEGPPVEEALRRLLDPSLAAGADAVVLGCTHYPFLRPALQQVCGPGVEIVDSGAAIAHRLGAVLAAEGERPSGGRGGLALATTGDPGPAGPVAARLLGEPVAVIRVEA